ncbi:MAG: CoA transferase [Pseudomonadales bacterium]|nr:CoA transferase [Pseudomonadales bacterium]
MNMNGLLSGTTILDLTRVVSGPCCTRTLADLGAEVLKIEPPEGDLLRGGIPKVDGIFVGFAQLNAGKRFMSINLASEKGQDLVQRLAIDCDVIIENYRPGVVNRLGLDYEKIRALKDDIIYCSISGYGQDGPAKNRRAYAPIIHAELGLLHQNAREWDTEPMPETASHADFAVGMQACNGILAALFHHAKTGEGAYIDASMAETMLAMNEATAVEVNGGVGDQLSPFRPGKAPIIQVKDGTFGQLPGNPAVMVYRVASVLGKNQELEELGWGSPGSMNIDQAKEKLREWAGEFEDLKTLEQALDKIKLPIGVVSSLADTAQTDWALARHAFKDVALGNGTAKLPVSPLRIKNYYVGPRTGAKQQGEENRDVLSRKLGLSKAELNLLEKENVLIVHRHSG